MRKAAPWCWAVAIAGVLWLILPYGFPNYDTRYALVWGGELAEGVKPDYAGPSIPTPHPLAELWGAVVSVFGADGGAVATTALAYLALGLLAYLVYRLGSLWFDRPIGALAALLVLTRLVIIANGTRAYVDLPYMVLLLAALVLETRRPRAGWPVLVLLALAGLLRPEAWLFSAVYVAYLLLDLRRDRGRLRLRRRKLSVRDTAPLLALAVSAPVLWLCFDLVTAGEPFYSFVATQNRVEALERQTGPVELVVGGPHRLTEVMAESGVLAAAVGLALALLRFRRRSLVGIVAVFLAGAAFAILACAGLSVISRYLMLLSALLCVFAAVALLGWRLLPRDDPWRRFWIGAALVVALAFIVEAPQQYDYYKSEREKLVEQSVLESDLHALAEDGAFDQRCGPITVPSDRAIPRLAAWLDLRPSTVLIFGEQQLPPHGAVLDTRTASGYMHFGRIPVPAGYDEVARNDSWRVYSRCP
jgi:4-amino-4-deoxy-L-arabinose transferase-like glycosyltransferase